jgi:hypothetical protein
MSEILSNIHYSVGLALGEHAEAMARLQEQAATGSRQLSTEKSRKLHKRPL